MNIHSATPFQTDAGACGVQTSLVLLPRVNVIVTCFNYGRFVGDALDSIAAQSYQNFDCTIVDDASSDGSFEIVERWIANRRDGRFRLIRNERNLGQMGSIVTALATSEGEFIALFDADDIWFPEFLMRHIEVHLHRSVLAGASSSDLIQIDAQGRMLAGSLVGSDIDITAAPQETLVSNNAVPTLGGDLDLMRVKATEAKYLLADLGLWRWSVASGLVFRRPLIELLLPARTEQLRLGADFYLMTLAHGFAGSFVIRNALGAYRRHGKNSFASLPVVGSRLIAPLSSAAENARNVYRAMFEHVLETSDRLSLVLSPAVVRKRARSLFRLCLRQGIAADHPRLNAVVGKRRVLEDRMRARIGFLRRKLT
jgi:glycosyltransferase involved in cell wall biosynthesis